MFYLQYLFILLYENLYKYKIIRIIHYLLFIIVYPLTKFRQNLPVKKIKKRLFCSSGNISLINALSILKQLDNSNCENYLIIESFKGGYDFWKNNYTIAKKLSFNKIKLICQANVYRELCISGWCKFDEIYMINHPKFKEVADKFKDANIYLFDEGCASLINYNLNPKFKNFYTHNYINKIDGYNFPKEFMKKFIHIDVSNFQFVSSQIESMFPIATKYDNNKKNILYCGIYWQVSGLDEETFINIQKTQIEELIAAGYHILFKPHPRETKFYGLDKNPNIDFIDSVLSVEIYDWDVLAVVGMSCSTLIHMPHYHKIPAFSNVLEESLLKEDNIKINLVRKIVKEYSPDYKKLLDLNVQNTSKEELKIQIKNIYDNFIKDKPLLSENKNI